MSRNPVLKIGRGTCSLPFCSKSAVLTSASGKVHGGAHDHRQRGTIRLLPELLGHVGRNRRQGFLLGSFRRARGGVQVYMTDLRPPPSSATKLSRGSVIRSGRAMMRVSESSAA